MTAISEYNQKQCQLWSSDQGLPQAKRTYSLIGLQVWTWKGKLPPSDQKIVLLLRRTQFWHKLWYHLRVFLGWIKTKGPTLDDLKTRVWTHQTLTSPPVRQILKELKTVDAKDTEAAAEVCLKSLEASETQIAQEQSKLLKQRLESEWGVAKTAEILTNPLLVPELHTQPPLVMAKGRIDQICIIVRNYFHNTGTLQKLKSELEQTVGAPITAQVMTKLNYQSYLNGLALITPETAEGVRQLAKDLQASADADAMLHKIETTCRTWLPGDEIIIKKHFNFDEAIAKLPLEEQRIKALQLKKIAILAYLKKQLARRAHLSKPEGAEFDITLLKLFGHGIDFRTIEDKDALHESIADFIQLELKKIETNCEKAPAIDQLKTEIALLPTIYRMNCASSFTVQEQRSKFLELRQCLWAKYEKEKASQGKIDLLPASFNREGIPLLGQMQEHFATFELHYQMRTALLKSARTHFLENYKRDDKHTFMNRLRLDLDRLVQIDQKQLIQRTRSEMVKSKEIQFITKYAPFIKQEFIQGYKLDSQGGLVEDSNAILGKGVCWAICHRLQIDSIKTPEKSVSELQFNEVEFFDRFQQARMHVKSHFNDVNFYLMDSETLAKEGLPNSQEVKILSTALNTSETLDQFVSRFTNAFSSTARASIAAKSHGWCKIGIGFDDDTGHAIAMRADPNKHSYWLFDPNVGLIEIPYANDDDAAYAQLLIAVEDLLKYYYGQKINRINVAQIKQI